MLHLAPIPSGHDLPSSWVDVNSGPSLLPQIDFHVLCVVVCMVPGKAALLMCPSVPSTTLGRGAVSQFHVIGEKTHSQRGGIV